MLGNSLGTAVEEHRPRRSAHRDGWLGRILPGLPKEYFRRRKVIREVRTVAYVLLLATIVAYVLTR
jgi:hypothetical protein